MKIKGLDVKTQIEVLEKSIILIKSNSFITGYFLCINIGEILNRKFDVGFTGMQSDIRKYIPIFTKKNATIACKEMKLTRPTVHESGGWWATNECDIRVKVLEWMINKLKNN